MKKLRIITLFTAFLFLLFSNSCQKTAKDVGQKSSEIRLPPTQSVIGGQPANINTIPYQAAIYLDGRFYGGGVILNNEWILTAAHVVTDLNTNTPYAANRISIRTGSTDQTIGGTMSAAGSIIVHSGFNISTGTNDIALVKLSTPLSFNQNQSPVFYSINSDPLANNDIVTVSGWGVTVCDPNAPASNNLNQTSIKVSDLSNPAIISCMPQTSTIQTAAYGDSGGPLIKNIQGIGTVLIGVVNSGDCTTGFTKYARVSYFADWIGSNTGIFNIAGPNQFCDSASYSIRNLPVGATIAWSVDLPNYASLSTNGNTAGLKTVNSGNVNLSAAITTQAGSSNTTYSVFGRKSLDPANSCSYALIGGGGPSPYFCNIDNGSGDASIVANNLVAPGTYETNLIFIGSLDVNNISLTVSSHNPTTAPVWINTIGTNQYKIDLKGSTTSASIKITYTGYCGGALFNYVYVRAPNGPPLPPVN